jgi:hypothetical protein
MKPMNKLRNKFTEKSPHYLLNQLKLNKFAIDYLL